MYNQKTKELRNFEMVEKEMEHMNSIYKLKTIKFEIIVSIALLFLAYAGNISTASKNHM
ncbi:MAG: hypothetical protein ACLT33_10615 [Lachnospira pectinoschiza]